MNPTRSTCLEIQNARRSAVEQRRPLPRKVSEHLAHCRSESCRELWEESLFLDPAIAAWREQAPDVDLTDRVLAEVGRGSTTPLVRRTERTIRKGAGILPALAAATAVACVVFAISLREPPPPRPAGTAVRDAPHEQPVIEDEPLQELGATYASWIQGATTRVSDTVTFVLPDDDPDSPSAGVPVWISLWEEGWEPVEEQLNRTLQELFRDSESEPSEATG